MMSYSQVPSASKVEACQTLNEVEREDARRGDRLRMDAMRLRGWVPALFVALPFVAHNRKPFRWKRVCS